MDAKGGSMMSQFAKTASQMATQQRLEKSKQKRVEEDQRIEKKIEEEKMKYIHKCNSTCLIVL